MFVYACRAKARGLLLCSFTRWEARQVWSKPVVPKVGATVPECWPHRQLPTRAALAWHGLAGLLLYWDRGVYQALGPQAVCCQWPGA